MSSFLNHEMLCIYLGSPKCRQGDHCYSYWELNLTSSINRSTPIGIDFWGELNLTSSINRSTPIGIDFWGGSPNNSKMPMHLSVFSTFSPKISVFPPIAHF